MKIGSEEHKNLFCRSFIESHKEYNPHLLPWPHLDVADIDRLRKIPFWQEALNTELDAGAKVSAYTQSIADPLVRDAIALQGHEEARHGQLLQYMIQQSRSKAHPSSRYPMPLSQPLLSLAMENASTLFSASGSSKLPVSLISYQNQCSTSLTCSYRKKHVTSYFLLTG